MRYFALALGFAAWFCAFTALAELRSLDDGELQGVSGQSGISLSANLSFAKKASDTRCVGGCGARVALQPAKGAGFLVLDNISGAFIFDGATIDVVSIESAAGFGDEGAAAGARALRVGLTNGRFENFKWTLAGSNQAVAGGASFKQTDLLTYQTNGLTKLQGNLYIFGTP